MHKELDQFVRNDAYYKLVEKHVSVNVFGIKWIYKNKTDENGVIIKNEACMVTHWYKALILEKQFHQ